MNLSIPTHAFLARLGARLSNREQKEPDSHPPRVKCSRWYASPPVIRCFLFKLLFEIHGFGYDACLAIHNRSLTATPRPHMTSVVQCPRPRIADSSPKVKSIAAMAYAEAQMLAEITCRCQHLESLSKALRANRLYQKRFHMILETR